MILSSLRGQVHQVKNPPSAFASTGRLTVILTGLVRSSVFVVISLAGVWGRSLVSFLDPAALFRWASIIVVLLGESADTGDTND